MLRLFYALALAGALFCGLLPSASLAEESWIAIATGSNEKAVYYGMSREPNRTEAEESALSGCRKHGKCTYAKSWDYGCIHAALGSRPSDGNAFMGAGPTRESAIAQCEKNGADCTHREVKSLCVIPTTSTSPKGEAPQASSQAPGTTAPTVDTGSTPAPPKVTMPMESMALLKKELNEPAFVLCPDANRDCYRFVDGGDGSLTERQLVAAEKTFKGVRSGAPRDDSYMFETLYDNLDPGKAATMRVRYQFADLVTGVGRYEGLICVGDARQESKAVPSWITCAYVKEVRKDRSTR